jgi:hypothetical protein
MNKLLKEAIADAKAVRETAMANAKIALEEAFTPRLQSMLSARLAEEEDMDDMDDEEAPAPAPDIEENDDMDGMYEEDYMNDGEDGTPADNLPEGDDMGEEELDLEAIIRELEGDDDMQEEPVTEGDDDMEEEPMKTEAEEKDEMDEDIDINEIIRSLTEEDGDEDMDEEPVTEGDDMEEEPSKDLEEAYRVIKFMQTKLNEVNLLNAKLLFSNKLFRNYELNESQKMKVIENFDRANNLREVKLVYSTICESLTSKKAKKQIKESYASKPTRSTAPKKEILSEGNQLAARWKKLANLK